MSSFSSVLIVGMYYHPSSMWDTSILLNLFRAFQLEPLTQIHLSASDLLKSVFCLSINLHINDNMFLFFFDWNCPPFILCALFIYWQNIAPLLNSAGVLSLLSLAAWWSPLALKWRCGPLWKPSHLPTLHWYFCVLCSLLRFITCCLM